MNAPINPQDEPFLASKSMVLILLSTGTMFALLLIYVIVRVAFHEDILQVVLGAMGMETAKTGTGIARNVLIDGPARQAYNASITLPASANPSPTQTNATPPPPLGGF